MDEQKKPRAREKKVVESGKGVEKQGEALGTGPVNNTGNYAQRREQEAWQAAQAQRPASAAPQRPSVGSAQRPASAAPQRPSVGSAQRPASSAPQRPSVGSAQRPASAAPQRPSTGSAQRPATQRPAASSGSGQKTYHSGTPQNGTRRASGGGFGGGKLILILLALVLLGGGGKLFGLFGGNNGDVSGTLQQVISTTTSTTTNTQTGTGGLGDVTSLLSSLLGSGGSAYDFNGVADLLPSMLGGSSASGSGAATGGASSGSGAYFTSSLEDNTIQADETVSSLARDKYTAIQGNGKDTVTILVYMCGTDLESQNGMGTADLKEMANATIGKNVNLIVFTGGCRRWKNNVVSNTVNQIYRIHEGGLDRIEADMGNGAMTSASTLSSFIRYGAKNYPANRMCLIFWDHGGGSISGFGYDEKAGKGQSMTLAGINTALKDGGVKFDFVGFDACLMATVENGLMLSQYADYMIASEETEPGVGWYYTNWLTKLSKNTSLSTVEIGKMITDDFVEVCNQKCRGQATTLSVVDLAELQATVPAELTRFSADTNELIQNNEYKKVSTARSNTREFAQQSKIDQIDLVHFARNLGTSEGKKLASALQGAVKYNRTGGGIRDAYGLSIYFPYKKASKVVQMVSTYQAIGMDAEYTRCIQEFASLEVSGQISAGTPVANYGSYGSGSSALPGLMDSLLGGGSGSSGGYGGAYTSSGLGDLMGSLFGGSAFGSDSIGGLADLFLGRTMTAEKAAAYILENHFDAGDLVWTDGKITLSKDQWALVENLNLNVFYDDGKGYIDLGMDPTFTIRGDSLIADYDGTWLSIDRQPVAYYDLGTVEEGDHYVISGYVPALLNGVQVNLILNFDDERPEGYIVGAQQVYAASETEAQAKMMIGIGAGDRLQFLCDYYDYEGKYQASYRLGSEITLGEQVEIANTPIAREKCRATYCFTDLYQQKYWTPVAPTLTE